MEPDDPRLHDAAEYVVDQLNFGMTAFPECMKLHAVQVRIINGCALGKCLFFLLLLLFITVVRSKENELGL